MLKYRIMQGLGVCCLFVAIASESDTNKGFVMIIALAFIGFVLAFAGLKGEEYEKSKNHHSIASVDSDFRCEFLNH